MQNVIVLLADAKKLDSVLAKDPSAVKGKGENGMTLLHMVVMMEARDAVDVLIKHEADVNVKGADGVTPP